MNIITYQNNTEDNYQAIYIGDEAEELIGGFIRANTYDEQDIKLGMNKLCVVTGDASVYEEVTDWSIENNILHITTGKEAQESLGIPETISVELPPENINELKVAIRTILTRA